MKAKVLSFSFFNFHFLFGIGAFQRVTAEKIKKFSAPELASQVARETLGSLLHMLSWRRPRFVGFRGFDQPKVYGGLRF
jgi:hypothetical protein